MIIILGLQGIAIYHKGVLVATFVSLATTKGIRLSKLNVNTECIINFAKTFDVAL